jgi:hypothetical protein
MPVGRGLIGWEGCGGDIDEAGILLVIKLQCSSWRLLWEGQSPVSSHQLSVTSGRGWGWGMYTRHNTLEIHDIYRLGTCR